MSPTSSSQEDVILPIMNDYMQQIVRGEKNHEFRKYCMPASVARIWFYLNAPFSHIAYVCEVDPARTRGCAAPTTTPENDNDNHEKLAEDGLGNKEFNEHHPDWIGYDYAYRIKSVYKLRVPVSLAMLKERYGFRAAPRGRLYLPPPMAADIVWSDQERLFPV